MCWFQPQVTRDIYKSQMRDQAKLQAAAIANTRFARLAQFRVPQAVQASKLERCRKHERLLDMKLISTLRSDLF